MTLIAARPATLMTLIATFILAHVAALHPVAANDMSMQFLEGLRARGYYDTAIEYLDELAASNDLDPEIKDQMDLQRGITLQQMGSAARVPEDREQYLSQAEAAFRKFIADHPAHDQAAFASSSLGELLFERARTLIWQTESPSNADKKSELQASARQLIDDAQGIYRKAFDLYEAQYKAFPTFIDQAREPEQFQQRLDAEARYLRAWFNLSRCTYERGQTYDKGTDERKQTLIKAAELFEEIHTSRRTNAIGLNARLMMGKCFQEQDDIGRALGIYNEMLQHRSEHPSVQNLKNIALHYRLICLNDPQKADYQLVLQQASEWLQAHRSLIATSTGLGILWEKAVAEEKLAEDRTQDAKAREVLLRQAMADSQQVARYPGAFREPANAMNRRLKAALGDKDKEPRDFETAFERARSMIDQIQKLRAEADAATSAEDKRAKLNALDMHLNEVGRLLQLALSLRDEATDAKAVAQARYLLSFIFFRQRKNLDAVIMASYCMTHDGAADPDTALNATDIAINAAVQAWNDAPANDREFETTLIRDVCLKVFDLYPQSAKANEARIRLGFVYQQLQNPLEAAKWFLQVPPDDPQYPSARINAGQSFWAAYAVQAASDQEVEPLERRSPDELKSARTEARKLLTEGIQLAAEKRATDARPSDEVIAAEVSLASILNLEGQFAETIQRLTAGGDNSVMQLIQVADSAARPETGIQSQSFAGLAYRLLLRAYVGTQQIDQAIATMALLEKTGGQDITAIYTQLGMELQEELQRLKQANETQRLTEVRASFEQFLEKVYAQRDPANYNSLLWIGETYFGLGQGVADDPVAAGAYYQKAATAYNEILSGQLTQEPTTTAIKLRLARCLRQQLKFPEAMAAVSEILAANPLALDAQFEAAHILSDWGANGEPERLMEAIQGSEKDSGQQNFWGWSTISRRLQQTLSSDTTPEFRERFLEARWQLSNSRRRYAATGAGDAQAQLRAALAEITVFVEIFRDIDPGWWAKFDRLYQDIQADLGESPKPLVRPAVIIPSEPQPAAVPAQTVSEDSPEANAVATAPAPGGGSILLPILGVCLAAGAAGGLFFLMKKPARRGRSGLPRTLSAPGSPDLSQVSVRQPAESTATRSTAPRAASTRASAASRAASAGGGKSAAAPRAAGGPKPAGDPSAPASPASPAAQPGPQPGAGAKIVRRPPTSPAKAAADEAAASERPTRPRATPGDPSASKSSGTPSRPAQPAAPAAPNAPSVRSSSPRPASGEKAAVPLEAPPAQTAPRRRPAGPASGPTPTDKTTPEKTGAGAVPPAKRPPAAPADGSAPRPTRPRVPGSEGTAPVRPAKPRPPGGTNDGGPVSPETRPKKPRPPEDA